MKNWDTLDADKNMIMGIHYTSGRDGRNVNKIVLHHNAGNLTTEECYELWQTREASAHYQVEENGTIGQLVWDGNTAWHAGDWDANTTSIGIEHANNHTGDPWTISEATLENGARLVAAICVHFHLGAPAWLVNVYPHSYFSATACPGEIAGSQHKKYMERALYWYRQMTGQPVTPAKPAQNWLNDAQIEQLARDVIAGKYGNGTARKTALGANYDTVQTKVNQILAGTPQKQSVDQVARDVIAGKYGNGEQRRQMLTAAGYSYTAVQNRVNEILLG